MRNKTKTYNKFFIDVIDGMLHPITRRNFIIDSEVFLFDTDHWTYKIDFYPSKGDKKSETLQKAVIEVNVSFSSFDPDDISFNGFGLNTKASSLVSAYDVEEQLEALCKKLESLL